MNFYTGIQTIEMLNVIIILIKPNLSNILQESRIQNFCVTLDCGEVFIERSRSSDNQVYTWSDYKHHNTIKFVVGISQNGFIKLLLDCYDRASDNT